ncbi:MFS transporter [Notoacmeibacter marinus]|uniref:MFS transporter n=1 Tax=Notoacmeibacter marinus TaxID=1876515 RepID=A0A231V247_9HYPH|nr:MFS transporter [Notoacmeibacter marinus]OXT01656.1 MFS transporter [Notoacmeibacter marinus]
MHDNISDADWRSWIAVCALGIGSFAIVTAELAPIGLLSLISDDLGVPTGQVGLIVTLYAWIAAGAAIASAVWLGGMPRRPLLVGLMLVLAISGVAAAFADRFASLMAARIVGAFAHGAFWAMIGTLGAQIVPKKNVGLATSIIFGGVSAASVLGVPMANFIGVASGWRMAFAIIGALSLLVAVAIWLTVPRLAGRGGIGAQALLRVLADRRFQKIFLATLLAITSHFMAFTYIEPFLIGPAGVSGHVVAPLLLAFGASGLAANVLTGAMIDLRLKAIVTSALVLTCGALLALAMSAPYLGVLGIGVLLMLWGGAIAAILVGLQTWILKEAGQDALQASAIYVALFNAAIGLGAALGAAFLSATGLSGLLLLAALIIGVGVFAIAFLREPGPVPAE